MVACLVACGGSKPNNKNLAPLPPDKPVAEVKPTPDGEKKPDVAPVAAKPLPPLEVKFERPSAAVKLVNAGKGKKAPLRYTPKAGSKQAVEVVMTFGQSAKAGDESAEEEAPPIVLTGEAETKAVDASGKADYALSMSAVDVRNPTGGDAEMIGKFKTVIASLGKLVITGSVEGTGAAPETQLRIEAPDQFSASAVDLLRITLPPWPVFPSEPIGLGAKWQTTRSSQLKLGPGVGIEMKHVTDYELVAKKGTTWTIKSKTVVSGSDQDVKGAKVSKIGGSGTQEISLDEGTLFPTYSSKIESSLTVTQTDKPAEEHGFKIASTVTAKAK